GSWVPVPRLSLLGTTTEPRTPTRNGNPQREPRTRNPGNENSGTREPWNKGTLSLSSSRPPDQRGPVERFEPVAEWKRPQLGRRFELRMRVGERGDDSLVLLRFARAR